MNPLVYLNPEYSIEDDYHFLKLFKKYDDKKSIINFKYGDNTISNQLNFDDYTDLNKIIGNGNELSRLAKLKRWVVENASGKGKNLPGRLYDNLNCIDIIRKAKEDGYSLNCRYLSYVYMQLAIFLGFRTRWVMCLPMDLRDDECHCVVEVYSKDLKKWIVVDAALDLFYFSEKGIPLNLLEMRKMLIERNKLKFFSPNKDYSCFVQNYWKKNIFRFKYLINNKINALSLTEIKFACLNPKDFILKDKKFLQNGKKYELNYFYNDRIFYEEE